MRSRTPEGRPCAPRATLVAGRSSREPGRGRVNDPDPRTLERARRGDAGAFEDLVRAYQGDVWRFAYHFTRDRALADDVTQEAFLRAYRFLKGFAATRGSRAGCSGSPATARWTRSAPGTSTWSA